MHTAPPAVIVRRYGCACVCCCQTVLCCFLISQSSIPSMLEAKPSVFGYLLWPIGGGWENEKRTESREGRHEKKSKTAGCNDLKGQPRELEGTVDRLGAARAHTKASSNRLNKADTQALSSYRCVWLNGPLCSGKPQKCR